MKYDAPRRAGLRLLAASLLLDGLLTLLLGKVYVQTWRHAGGPLGASASWLLGLPGWFLRLLGLGEAYAGGRILAATRPRVRDIYSLFALVYDPFLAFWNATLARGVDGAVDRAVAQHLPAGGSVLDLGCGTGANLARLLRLGIPFSRYVGVDLTPEMLGKARRKFAHLPNAAFAQGDLLRDPLPQGEFDLVVSTWVFSHLGEGAGGATAKALRRLKPGGHLVILLYSQPYSWLDRVAEALGRLLLAKPVPREVYMAFPGRVALERLMGGMATLLVLSEEQALQEGNQDLGNA